MFALPQFGTRFVGLAIVFFCYNGFYGTNSVADLQKRFEVVTKNANGKVGVVVEPFKPAFDLCPKCESRCPALP